MDSEEQKVGEVMGILRSDIDTLGDEALEFCDPDCVRRFLSAKQWNVEMAAAQMKKTLDWRHKTKPWAVVCDECRQDPFSHNMRQVGTDGDGRPVIYTSFSQARSRFNVDENMKHLLGIMENATSLMRKRKVEKWVWVVDFDGFSLRDCDPRSALRTADLLTCYPERLHLAILLDAPSLFSGIWRAVRAVLDPVTTSKVRFVPRSQMPEAFGELFPAELAAWLLRETEDNRDPQRRGGRKAYWEWQDPAVSPWRAPSPKIASRHRPPNAAARARAA